MKDDQLTASSFINNVKGPASSRLNSPAVAGISDGAWEPRYNNQKQWIQVFILLLPCKYGDMVFLGRGASGMLFGI